MKPLVIAALVCALASPALAQAVPEPISVNGVLVAYTDTTVTITPAGGAPSTVAMKPDWFVSLPQRVGIETLKTGDFVATANLDVAPNRGRATELRIMEPGFRPEVGTHPTARRPGTMMTHATVASVTANGEGHLLVLTAPDGPREVLAPTGVPVTGYTVKARATLKPGDKVNAVTRLDPDGVWRAGRLLLVP